MHAYDEHSLADVSGCKLTCEWQGTVFFEHDCAHASGTGFFWGFAFKDDRGKWWWLEINESVGGYGYLQSLPEVTKNIMQVLHEEDHEFSAEFAVGQADEQIQSDIGQFVLRWNSSDDLDLVGMMFDESAHFLEVSWQDDPVRVDGMVNLNLNSAGQATSQNDEVMTVNWVGLGNKPVHFVAVVVHAFRIGANNGGNLDQVPDCSVSYE